MTASVIGLVCIKGEKMAAVLQTTYSNVFSRMKNCSISNEISSRCSLGSNWQQISIGLGDSLEPVIWANDDLVWWRLYVSLGLDELETAEFSGHHLKTIP